MSKFDKLLEDPEFVMYLEVSFPVVSDEFLGKTDMAVLEPQNYLSS